MAFTAIPASWIEVGQAIKKRLFQRVSDNLDDLDTRVSDVEASVSKIVLWDGNIYRIGSYATSSGILFHRVESGLTLTDCKVWIYDKGGLSSGTIEVDVQKSTSADFTSSVSVFTTRPSLDMSTASSYDESNNAVFNTSNNTASEGDYLRIDVTSIPSGLGVVGLFLVGEPG